MQGASRWILPGVAGLLTLLGGCLGLWEGEESPPASAITGYPHAAFDVRWPDTDTVEFDASRSFSRRGRIVEYEWDFGDGTQARDVLHVISHRYEKPGWYTVSLRVRDSEGLEATAQRVIVVAPEGAVNFATLNPPCEARVPERTVVVIRNYAQLQRVWSEAFENPQSCGEPPEIDFSREMGIALFLGTRPYPVYRVRIEGIRVVQGKLEIRYSEIETLGFGCAVPAVIVYPYLLVQAQRVDLPAVYFYSKKTEYHVCRYIEPPWGKP